MVTVSSGAASLRAWLKRDPTYTSSRLAGGGQPRALERCFCSGSSCSRQSWDTAAPSGSAGWPDRRTPSAMGRRVHRVPASAHVVSAEPWAAALARVAIRLRIWVLGSGGCWDAVGSCPVSRRAASVLVAHVRVAAVPGRAVVRRSGAGRRDQGWRRGDGHLVLPGPGRQAGKGVPGRRGRGRCLRADRRVPVRVAGA